MEEQEGLLAWKAAGEDALSICLIQFRFFSSCEHDPVGLGSQRYLGGLYCTIRVHYRTGIRWR